MVAFGNPVIGTIRPPGSPLIVGNFRVSCSFTCHMARTPPTQGTDIGNARCGDPVLAMTTGTISLIRLGKVGSTASADASIFRIKRPDGWEVGIAHHRLKAGLAVGQAITEGTIVGTLDKVGATACHVHVGCKDPSGKEVDVWPLLKQNGATEEVEDVLQGTNPQRIVNRGTTVKGDNTRFRSSPFVKADNILAEFDTGAAFVPDWSVDGTLVGTSKRWYAGWGMVGVARQVGYFHESVLSPLAPIEQSGHSDAELIEAAKRAGYNAAVDVSAAAATTAAKYPKP